MSFFGHDEPLGMPKGSVRALIVVLPLICAIVLWQRGLTANEVMELLKVAFGWYFITRVADGAVNRANGR